MRIGGGKNASLRTGWDTSVARPRGESSQRRSGSADKPAQARTVQARAAQPRAEQTRPVRNRPAQVSNPFAGSAANVAHGAQSGADWTLLALTLVLLCIGLTMVFSSSGVASMRLQGDSYFFFRRQLIFAGIGLICLYLAYVTPRARLEKLQYPLLFLCLLLLVITLSPLGVSVNGARRWINLIFIRLQPMELAKIALVFYLAFFLSSKQHIIKTFSRGIIPPFLITGLMCLLLLAQPDFGGASVMSMLLFFMCLVGGTRLLYLVLSALLAGGAATLLIIMEPYRFQRLTSFMDPFANAQGSGYQLVQSFYAIGSGGIFGLGLGAGRQKLFYLPEAHTDFIMAVVCEELGLIGLSVVFILMGLVFWRGLRIALRQPDLRGRLTAFGLTLVLAIPMLLNMAVVSGTVPSKGVPMPFFSYGGTSLITSLLCVGLLLNYSRSAQAKAVKIAPPPRSADQH